MQYQSMTEACSMCAFVLLAALASLKVVMQDTLSACILPAWLGVQHKGILELWR